MEELLNKEIVEKVKKVIEKNGNLKNGRKKSEKRRNLIKISNKLLKSIGRCCWKTEKTLAEELETSIRQIKYAKAYLYLNGLIEIEFRKNGNRINPIHFIIKKIEPELEIAKNDYEIDWSVLNDYSPKDFKNMKTEEQLDIYAKMNLPFIPIHYPIFADDKVRCSCELGEECEKLGKHPVIRYKNLDFSKQSTFEKMKNYWLKKDNKFNIGFLTNNFAVFDVDFRHGGQFSLEMLEETYGEIPKNLLVKSGNGFHIYVTNAMASFINFLDLPGIDVRSKGGLVVAPFSLHKSGKIYEWQSLLNPGSLPDELMNDIQSETPKTANSDDISAKDRLPNTFAPNYFIPDGKRNMTLFRVASRERGGGKDYDRILAVIKKINEVNCQPPLTLNELEGIAKSASQYLINKEKELGLKS